MYLEIYKKRQNIYIISYKLILVNNMYTVKVIDESHEKDLEAKVNSFLRTISNKKIVDIKFQVSVGVFSSEQIYCFSAMIIYIDWEVIWKKIHL